MTEIDKRDNFLRLFGLRFKPQEVQSSRRVPTALLLLTLRNTHSLEVEPLGILQEKTPPLENLLMQQVEISGY
jgi:hypothetical protein